MTGENGNMYMPVVPMGNGYGNGNGDGGMFGGNWMWFLLVWMAMFGWGNGGFGGFGGGGGGSEVQRGFDQSAIMNGIQGVQGAVSNGFAQAEIAANGRQMSDMNQYFQMQTAFQNCCCENRLASANLGNTVLQDGALTRQAIAGGIQSIQDKLCQLEMDGIKQNYENRIAGMQNTIDALRDANQNFRNAASFSALGDRMQASQDAQTNAIEQYLAPTARPAYIVPNPNCCPQNGYGYGCGCGG